MQLPIRFLFTLAALMPAHAVLAETADDRGDVNVDVVVDQTEAGHKVARPTPDKPAYYLPLTIGYKEIGYVDEFQRPPPATVEMQHEIALALYEQGYRVMTRADRPTLVLAFWWGYMSPSSVDVDARLNTTARIGALVGPPQNGLGGWGSGNLENPISPGMLDYVSGGGDDSSAFSIGSMNTNEPQMQALVFGDNEKYHLPQKFEDPRIYRVKQLAKQPRYYLMVSAFDFQSWLHHKPVLLWRAHASTELWGHYFDQVAGTLITTAAPYFGSETKMPQLVDAPFVPLGHVRVGTPAVTDYVTKSASSEK